MEREQQATALWAENYSPAVAGSWFQITNEHTQILKPKSCYFQLTEEYVEACESERTLGNHSKSFKSLHIRKKVGHRAIKCVYYGSVCSQ